MEHFLWLDKKGVCRGFLKKGVFLRVSPAFICLQIIINQVIFVADTLFLLRFVHTAKLSLCFHDSWQATAHTWVNTLCSSSCPIHSLSLSVTDEDHWLLQGSLFVFILHTVRLTGLSSNRRSISLHQNCPSRHQRDAATKGPPKIPPNPPHAEQAGLTAVCITSGG